MFTRGYGFFHGQSQSKMDEKPPSENEDDTLKCTGKPPEFHGKIDGLRFRFSQQNQSIADWILLPTN